LAAQSSCLEYEMRSTWVALGPAFLEMGAWLTPKNTPFPHMYYRAEFDRSWTNGTSVDTEIRPKKTGPLAFCLSRSLKVIGNGTDRSGINDFLLAFYGNRRLIVYRFQDIVRNAGYSPTLEICPPRMFSVVNDIPGDLSPSPDDSTHIAVCSVRDKAT